MVGQKIDGIEVSNSVNEIDVSYQWTDNTIRWALGDASSDQVRSKTYKIAVFFK